MLSDLWPIPCAGCGTEGNRRLCAACTPRAAFALDPAEMIAGSWASEAYDSGLGRAVLAAKGSRDRRLAKAVADAIAPCLAEALPPVDAVVPVPSPWTRRLIRGFATSSLLADALGRELGVAVHHRALSARRGRRQASLSPKARGTALAGKIRARQAIAGRVLLVDDVRTTGSTVQACARELLGAGASEVFVAVACATTRRSA